MIEANEQPEVCPYCGKDDHKGLARRGCPTVKAIEYHPDGSVKRVEFLTPADYMPPLPQIPWPTSPPTYVPAPQHPYHPPWGPTTSIGG